MKDIFLILRKYVAPAILVLFSARHAFALLKDSRHAYKQPADRNSTENSENRFAALRERLSESGCKKTGYITDVPESDGDWFLGYYRAQYSLSPVVVDYSLQPSLIVANLRDPSSLTSILRNNQLSLVSDYGNGVILLSRQPN